MEYEQTLSFVIAKGGNAPGMCLANVIAGYSIAPRYQSAWEAWQNTQQHSGEAPPDIDVPLFFSYTTTIDGVNKNWGHIGVRLSDGRFWSDGTIYASVDAYLANHTPKYVGWGESINNVQVLKGGNMPTLVDDGNIDLLYQGTLHRLPAQSDKDARRGQVYTTAMQELFESDEYKIQEKALKNPSGGGGGTILAPGNYTVKG